MRKTGLTRIDLTPPYLVGSIGSMVISVSLAGLVALMVGGAELPRHAIAYGMGWEATLKGIGTGGSASIK
jgi:hypothetical protein